MISEKDRRTLLSIRSREDAVRAYSERFGGFPSFLMMGATDEAVIAEVRHSIVTGRKMSARAGREY